MDFSHHISIDKVLDHPEGQLRLSIRDRHLMMTVAQARILGAALMQYANEVDPPLPAPEPPVEVSEAPEV